jgi:hypothetical protein
MGTETRGRSAEFEGSALVARRGGPAAAPPTQSRNSGEPIMTPRKRVLLLISIMAFVVLLVLVSSLIMLFQTALDEEKARLVETAKSQARLIEAIARFDAKYSKNYPKGAREATLSQIVDAHRHYRSFGKTGEFTLSKRDGDDIVFLLSHHNSDLRTPKSVPFDSGLAEPMVLALSGQSGTIIGLDYRGETVLAAYEPVQELDLGIVAKIDLEEIRAPFIRAGLLSGLIAILGVVAGSVFFVRITNPLLEKLEETITGLRDALNKVKLLTGLLPICSTCKKIRDDRDRWMNLEEYIGDHSEARFSHGICPDCMKKYYAELDKGSGI